MLIDQVCCKYNLISLSLYVFCDLKPGYLRLLSIYYFIYWGFREKREVAKSNPVYILSMIFEERCCLFHVRQRSHPDIL